MKLYILSMLIGLVLFATGIMMIYYGNLEIKFVGGYPLGFGVFFLLLGGYTGKKSLKGNLK